MFFGEAIVGLIFLIRETIIPSLEFRKNYNEAIRNVKY